MVGRSGRAWSRTAGRCPASPPRPCRWARYAALAIARSLRGKALPPFRYVDKGSLATIGRRSAVAQFGRVRLSGFPAWLAWLTIHVFFLIGFRNRFVVMINWAWAYFTYERSARLILGRGGPGR